MDRLHNNCICNVCSIPTLPSFWICNVYSAFANSCKYQLLYWAVLAGSKFFFFDLIHYVLTLGYEDRFGLGNLVYFHSRIGSNKKKTSNNLWLSECWPPEIVGILLHSGIRKLVCFIRNSYQMQLRLHLIEWWINYSVFTKSIAHNTSVQAALLLFSHFSPWP